MPKRYVFLALALIVMLAAGGCARAKPASESAQGAFVPAEGAIPEPPTPAEVLAEMTYRLAQPVGANLEAVAGAAFAVLVENCAGTEALERAHREYYALEPTLSLDTSGLDASLAAHHSAMEQVVREAYGLAAAPQLTEEMVSLSAPAGAQVEYELRWEELHDTNTLEAVAGDQVVARVPLQVSHSARLVIVSSAPKPCPTEGAVSVPVIVTEEGAKLEVQLGEETAAPPGSDLAMALVKEYLAALDAGDLERAYGLLHEVYQQRMPFERYKAGYAPVQEITVHSIELVQVSQYLERAEALATLVMEVSGEERYSDWLIALDVSITRGKPPYQRSISAVRMQELGLQ